MIWDVDLLPLLSIEQVKAIVCEGVNVFGPQQTTHFGIVVFLGQILALLSSLVF